jgi:HSP20 family protein
MQAAGLIDRVKHVLRRTVNKVGRTQTVPVSRGSTALEALGNRPLLTPPVDVFENEQEVLICADVPGAAPDNTEIHWNERSGLSLYVKVPATATGRPLGAEIQETCDWYRAFQAPAYVDLERSESELKNGVLTIHLPKRASATPRAVPIIETAD